MSAHANDIEAGNLHALDTQATGWFLGYSDWTKSLDGSGPGLRHMPKQLLSHSLTMKWTTHAKGDPRGSDKPVSEGRTLSILVSGAGRFRIQFSTDKNFPHDQSTEYLLTRHGDFCIWGAGLYHRWRVDADCTILTVRWTPQP